MACEPSDEDDCGCGWGSGGATDGAAAACVAASSRKVAGGTKNSVPVTARLKSSSRS
jgi:hypothetical protein